MIIQNRRDFLKMLALAGAASPFANLLDPSFTFAAGTNGTPKNLIVINLQGGFDALAAFPYYADPNYGASDNRNVSNYIRSVRPTIYTLPASTAANANAGNFDLKANNYIGFCPAFAGLKPIYDAGGLALIQGVGIEVNSRGNGSHDYCENAYSYGRKDLQNLRAEDRRGWFGRLIDQLGFDSQQAFGFGTPGRPDFLTADSTRAPIVAKAAENLVWSDPLTPNRSALTQQYTRQLMQAAATSTKAQADIKATLLKSVDVADFVSNILLQTNPGGSRALIGTYPSSTSGYITLGPALKSVARMIAANHGSNRSQLFYTLQTGFDTHGNQGGFDTNGASGSLHNLLTHVGSAITALVTDLKNNARPAWNNTVIVLISEFGRSVKENGGNGSDHGHGATLMMMGGPVHGGVYGTIANAQSLTDNNIIMPNIEFQNLLAPAVRWFGGNDTELFRPEYYTRVPSVADSIL